MRFWVQHRRQIVVATMSCIWRSTMLFLTRIQEAALPEENATLFSASSKAEGLARLSLSVLLGR